MNIEEIESKCWNLLSRIKDNNIVWEVDNAEMPDKLEFLIRFPNGKQGEIDMAIAMITLKYTQSNWRNDGNRESKSSGFF